MDILDNLLDELSHVLTQCFTARPLALSMPVERMGAGMLLMTVTRERHTKQVFIMVYYVNKIYSK